LQLPSSLKHIHAELFGLMLVISFGFCIFGQARVAGHYFAAAPGADHWDVESRPGDSAALPKKDEVLALP